ncbi:MAG TPA: hypothetical protein VI653_02990 [Steroidobacteraceae bacterium]
MVDSSKPLPSVLDGLTHDPQGSETVLLLALLDLALTNIGLAASNQDKNAAAQCMTKAVETYGSVKSLLPKLGLLPAQTALVQERLDTVRRRLWTGPMKSAGGS